MIKNNLNIGFCDLNPPLNTSKATAESLRCYFCYDAPCIQACPTEIDIPNFIRKISTGSYKSAAIEILSENIMGQTCAKVCPVESLCQDACVRNTGEKEPVQIGLLQRFATDEFFKSGEQPFQKAASSGKKIAIIGAGPAGLSCAHRLALMGHHAVIFEAKEKPGGLNEYGLAPYKVTNNSIKSEIDFILSLGGIEIMHGFSLGKNLLIKELKKNFDAIFIGIGLSDANPLGFENENEAGVFNAISFIEKIKQSENLETLEIGKNIVVIGGGSTAIDIAIEMKALGAKQVHLAYRRTLKEMKATIKEQNLAQKHGVYIHENAKPHKLNFENFKLKSVTFEDTKVKSETDSTPKYFTLEACQVFKAIGQQMNHDLAQYLASEINLNCGKISVDENKRTSLEGVYAGGDCINGGDLTVTAVQDGKIAAHKIHEFLTGEKISYQQIKKRMIKK